MPGYQAPATGRHTEFLGWRPSDMIGELLRARGERIVPGNPTILAERAFHTTSDFPALLSAAANKMLLAAYAPAAPTYRTLFLRRDFRDFKPHRHLRVGDFPTLLPLSENGEVQAGTMSESQELVFLQTFARRICVTRQMLVNDDLGAFTDFASMTGRRVADFENATAYALLNSAGGDGPTLTTGAAAVFGTAAARRRQPGACSTCWRPPDRSAPSSCSTRSPAPTPPWCARSPGAGMKSPPTATPIAIWLPRGRPPFAPAWWRHSGGSRTSAARRRSATARRISR